MPKKSSFTASMASISRLLPKRKKHGGGSHQHRNTYHDGSFSSPATSSDEDRCSNISEGTDERYDRSSSRSDDDSSRLGKLHSRDSHHKGKSSRRSHRSSNERRHLDRDRNRGRRNEFYYPDSHGDHMPQRHRKTVGGDDATRMVDLLMRTLPLYGKGDSKLDTLVLDTMDRLPSHALEMKDVDGNTLLLIACQTGAYDLLPALLEKGCLVNARNNLGASCLHYACSVQSFAPDVAMALLRHGASAEIADLQFLSTPLHLAAYSGHIELCAELCRSGAIPTTVDRNGFDSIHYSKQNGHMACAQLLLSYTQPRDVTSPNDVSTSADWVRYIDDSTGAVFFHNIETGTSVWGDPRIGDQDGDGQIPEQVESTGTSVDQKVKPSDTASNIFQSPESREMNHNKNDMPSDIGVYSSQQALLHEKPVYFPRPGTLPSIAAATKVVKENFLPPSLGTMKALRSPTNLMSPGGLSAKHPASSHLLEEMMSPTSKQMESELMHRLEDLEIKMMQQSIEVPHKAGFESSHAKESIANLMSTIVKLQTDGSAKELEILSLNRRLAAAELNDNLISAHANVGDGNVQDDRLELNLVELLAARESQVLESENKDREILLLLEKVAKLEARERSDLPSLDAAVGNPEPDAKIAYKRELEDAHNEIKILKGQVDEAKKVISVFNARYEDTRCRLEIAEQCARVEKASRTSTESLLEQTMNREKSDSAMTQLVQEEKRMAEETVRQLKGQLHVIEDKALVDRSNHSQELERLSNKCSAEQARAAQLTKELEKMMAVHRINIAELQDQHKKHLGKANEEFNEMKSNFDSATVKLKELEEKSEMQEVFHSKMKVSYELDVRQLRNELDGTKTEVVNVNAKLKEATIVKMELMVAKHDSDVAMENAVEKARLAESKLQKMTEFISRTEELRMSNDKLQISLQDQTEKRKILHNTLEDLKGRIRVYVRVRPLSENEIKANYRVVLSKEDERTCIMEEDAPTASDARDWEFDKIFCGSDVDGNTQEAVFKDTSLLITSAIDGFNVCIFAYGQTGSGKTFTMIGSDSDKGIAPRVAHDLFQKLRERESIHHIDVSASILELYSDKLRDLLVPGNDEFHDDLKIRLAEHTSSGLVEVEGCRTERAANANELLDIFDRGAKSRASSSTKMNSVSSRSHMIVTIVLTFRNKRTNDVMHGKLTLVDLAGSERVSKSGATGLQLKEAQSINKSLSALGDVIGALTSKGHQHIPYRNNPLTMLMSDSIGGNAKTLMFVCCSPADYNRRESSDSLDFAKRCRNVTNNAQSSNASASNVHQIRALRAELLKMKEKVNESTTKRSSAGVKSPERDRNFLPKLQQSK